MAATNCVKKHFPGFFRCSPPAASSIISLFQSDSESDQSTGSLLPSPKQPRIEQETEVSVVNIKKKIF